MKTLKYMGITTTLAAGMLFVPAAFAQAGGAKPDNSGQSSSSAQSGTTSSTDQNATSSSSAQTSGTSDTGNPSGTSGNLPKTGSEFPLIGLAGLLSAAGAMTLRKLAKS